MYKEMINRMILILNNKEIKQDFFIIARYSTNFEGIQNKLTRLAGRQQMDLYLSIL